MSKYESRHLVCGCILCICEIQGQCQGCGAKLCAEHAKEAGHYTDCQQPTAGEFNDFMEEVKNEIDKAPKMFYQLQKRDELIKKLHGRLDRAEAINKDLLDAITRITGLGCLRDRDMAACKKGDMCGICHCVATIAKAKKEAEVIEKKHGGCWPEAKKEE